MLQQLILLLHVLELRLEMMHWSALLDVGPQNQICPAIRGQEPPVLIDVLRGREEQVEIAFALLLLLEVSQHLKVKIIHVDVTSVRQTAKRLHPVVLVAFVVSL